MDEPRERDWLRFWVHFLCGAVLGAVGGLHSWARSDYGTSTSWVPGVLFVGGGALLVGLIAGFAAEGGDDFWHSIGSRFHRWW